MIKSPYFKEKKAGHPHKLRLFCFPYAGGNNSIYNDWDKELDKDISLVTVHLKGRVERIAEDAINDMNILVDELYENIKPYLDDPFAFYGHSMGGLVAFALLKKIEQNGYKAHKLIISASRPPHLYAQNKMDDYSDATLIKKLKDYGNTPDYVLESQELMELILPTFRADYQVVDSCKVSSDKTLKSKTIIFNCEDDIEKNDSMEWEEYFENSCGYLAFEDGHFFINTQTSKVINSLNQVFRLT